MIKVYRGQLIGQTFIRPFFKSPVNEKAISTSPYRFSILKPAWFIRVFAWLLIFL